MKSFKNYITEKTHKVTSQNPSKISEVSIGDKLIFPEGDELEITDFYFDYAKLSKTNIQPVFTIKYKKDGKTETKKYVDRDTLSYYIKTLN